MTPVIMPGLDAILFALIAKYMPYVSGSLVTLSLIIGVLTIIARKTKNKTDDRLVARLKRLVSDFKSGKSPREIVADAASEDPEAPR